MYIQVCSLPVDEICMFYTSLKFSVYLYIYVHVHVHCMCHRKVQMMEDSDGNVHLRNLSLHPASNEEEGERKGFACFSLLHFLCFI